jgi:tRNA (pseudouridine54-N1)-methyltransferase
LPERDRQFEDPFNLSEKNFIVIAHRASSDGSINLKDLCGASGRWDGIARCITASLFLSHSMRRDTTIHIILKGPGDPPKILSVNGRNVKYLNPDERASSALMRKNLDINIGDTRGRSIRTSPGIHITRGDLALLLERIEGKLFLMNESGTTAWETLEDHESTGRIFFALSDDMEFEEEELNALKSAAEGTLSVGPLSLHSYQVITILHNLMDRSSIGSS